MIDILDRFKQMEETERDNFFINNFELLNGIYIKINKDKDEEIQDENIYVYKDKKDIVSDMDKYEWFRNRLFYNLIINMSQNKGISECGKQFTSVTPHSLSFRYIMFNKHNEDKINKFVKGYFLELAEYYSFDKDKVDEYSSLFMKKLIEVKEKFKGIKESTRIILMLDVDVSEYKKSYDTYIRDRIYLSEKTRLNIDGQEYGVTPFSTSLDNKKLILNCNNTRVFNYVYTVEDLILINKIAKIKHLLKDLLSDEDQVFNISFNKDGAIQSYQFDTKNDEKYPFNTYSIISSEEPNEIPKTSKKSRMEVMSYIDFIISDGILGKVTNIKPFNKSDMDSYYDFANNIYTDKRITQNVAINKNCFIEYFKKDVDIDISNELEKVLKLIYEYKLNFGKEKKKKKKKETEDDNKNFENMTKIFDTIVGVMEYISSKEMYGNMAKNIKEIYEKLKLSNDTKVIEIDSNEEFFYLGGQVLQYLSLLSKSKKYSYIEIGDFNKISSGNELKNKIIEKYEQYSHRISNYPLSFINLAYQAIMSYNITGENIDKLKKSELWYYYHAGLVGNNIFFMNKSENVDEEETNE